MRNDKRCLKNDKQSMIKDKQQTTNNKELCSTVLNCVQLCSSGLNISQSSLSEKMMNNMMKSLFLKRIAKNEKQKTINDKQYLINDKNHCNLIVII